MDKNVQHQSYLIHKISKHSKVPKVWKQNKMIKKIQQIIKKKKSLRMSVYAIRVSIIFKNMKSLIIIKKIFQVLLAI